MRSLTDELEIESRHADHMAAMAQYWMRRAQDAEHLAAVLVLAAGGTVRVCDGDLQETKQIELERWQEDEFRETVFRARAIEARRAGTAKTGPVGDESAVA